MSHSSTQTVACPQCGETLFVDLWDWINLSLDPGLREEVVSGEINRAECVECGYEGQLERPLLVLDPSRAAPIFVAPVDWRADPALMSTAEVEAERLVAAATEASLEIDDPPPTPIIVYGYAALATYLLALDARDLIEDLFAPDDPNTPLSDTGRRQRAFWLDAFAAPTLPALTQLVEDNRADIRIGLLSALFTAIGRAARSGDSHLAGFLRGVGDAILEIATSRPPHPTAVVEPGQ